MDAERQIEIQIEIDKLLMDDFYGVTIFQFPAVTAYSDRVEGVNSRPALADHLLEHLGLGADRDEHRRGVTTPLTTDSRVSNQSRALGPHRGPSAHRW